MDIYYGSGSSAPIENNWPCPCRVRLVDLGRHFLNLNRSRTSMDHPSAVGEGQMIFGFPQISLIHISSMWECFRKE